MADLPTQFWGGWIVVLTLVSFAALAALVWSVYFSRASRESDEDADLVWDDTLREGQRRAPMWWFWFIFSLMVFSVIYVMLYPGLGRFEGALKWSQGKHISDNIEDYRDAFDDQRAALAAMSYEALADHPGAMQAARSVYENHCTVCHGHDAAGQAGLFPSLVDDEWQWGGEPAQIMATLVNGRQAAMPAWGAVLGDEGVSGMTGHVLAMTRGEAPADTPAAQQYAQFCAVCHGPDGAGNPALGAPPLNDGDWLYGGTHDAVYATLMHGRNGRMPAFGERLDATQLRLLTAWLAAAAPGLEHSGD